MIHVQTTLLTEMLVDSVRLAVSVTAVSVTAISVTTAVSVTAAAVSVTRPVSVSPAVPYKMTLDVPSNEWRRRNHTHSVDDRGWLLERLGDNHSLESGLGNEWTTAVLVFVTLSILAFDFTTFVLVGLPATVVVTGWVSVYQTSISSGSILKNSLSNSQP